MNDLRNKFLLTCPIPSYKHILHLMQLFTHMIYLLNFVPYWYKIKSAPALLYTSILQQVYWPVWVPWRRKWGGGEWLDRLLLEPAEVVLWVS